MAHWGRRLLRDLPRLITYFDECTPANVYADTISVEELLAPIHYHPHVYNLRPEYSCDSKFGAWHTSQANSSIRSSLSFQ